MTVAATSAKPAPTDNDAESAPAAGRPIRPLAAAAAVLLVLAVAAAGILLTLGWRGHAMTTPSMGRTAPVGSLVITRPVAAGDLHVGDIIAFHPPGRPDTGFVHRIVAVTRDATGVAIRTRGDINGTTDTWTLHSTDVTGRQVLVIPDGGFVLEMLPFLLVGVLLIALVTAKSPTHRRGPLRTLLGSLLCAFLLWHFHPLDRVELISQTLDHNTGRAIFVPTGALPLRITAAGGTHTDLTPGQVGSVVRHHLPTTGHFAVTADTHLTGWWWLLTVLWLAPLAPCVRRHGRVAHPASEHEAEPTDESLSATA